MATVSLTLELRDDERLYVDDSTDGSCAGCEIACEGCGTPVGYPDALCPATLEEAESATFIPFVQSEWGGPETIFCLGCVKARKNSLA